MPDRVPLINCQQKLLTIWLFGVIPALLLMITRSLFGSFSGKEQEVWSWFVPTFLPTLSLMIGAYAKIAFQDSTDSKTADKFFFRISAWSSIFYLVVLSSVILSQPFLNAPALETFARSGLFLSGIQGFVAACLGGFFVSQK